MPSLPQYDSVVEQAERKIQLSATRLIYDYEKVEGLPMPLASDAAATVQVLGLEDWVIGQAENQLRIFVNLKIWEILSEYQGANANIRDYADKIAEIYNSSRYKELASKIEISEDSLSQLAGRITGVDTDKTQDFPNFESYAKVFVLYPIPDITGLWQDDKTFASQRLAGLNPMAIKQVTFSDDIGTNWNNLKKKTVTGHNRRSRPIFSWSQLKL